jgi:hypothetical protein
MLTTIIILSITTIFFASMFFVACYRIGQLEENQSES